MNFSPWSRYSGGGQRSTHNLARALARRGHRVSVVFTKPPWEAVPLPAALAYEVIWAALPALRTRSGAPLRPLTAISVAREVRRLLDSEPELVVHGNGEEAALVPQLRRTQANFAFVMTPRYPWLPGTTPPSETRPPLLRRVLPANLQAKYWLLGHALRGADRICPTSLYAARLVQQAYRVPMARMTVIPNGVSEEFSTAPLPEPQPATASFGVYFGRLAREKGVHTILDALAQLGAEPRKFVFAGRGPELTALQARARKLGLERRVEFQTWLDAPQLAALVRSASFAVLPSLEESFGNTMAEAMMLGVPVISARAGSIPELITHRETGWLIEPGDARALADAIETLARDPALRQRLGAAGRDSARAKYSWDHAAQRFEQVYTTCLEARNHRSD